MHYYLGMSIHPKAEVHESVEFGSNLSVWEYSKIRENCIIGEYVILGQSAYIGAGDVIGSNVKIQNSAQVYEPAVIESGVFIGPGVILTNDKYPKAVNPDNSLKQSEDWHRSGVIIREGASIGAGAILVAPVEIGKWAMVGAGSVVTKEVPDYSLVVGNPARIVGVVSADGRKRV